MAAFVPDDVWVDPEPLERQAAEWIVPEVMRLEADQDAYWQDEQFVGEPIDEDCLSPDAASKILADLYIDKLNSGKLYATDVCKFCYWAVQGGMGGAVVELARRPGLHSYVYSSHINKNIRPG